MSRPLRSASIFVLLAVVALSNAQSAPTKPPKADPALAKLEATYKAKKAVYVKKPKDSNARKQYVNATVSFGTATMKAASLPPRVKYVGALRLYREALKLDPKNAEALRNKKVIEDIYKSMGREIPK